MKYVPYCYGEVLNHLLRNFVLERHELRLPDHVLHQRPQAAGHEVDELVRVLLAHGVKVVPLRSRKDGLAREVGGGGEGAAGIGEDIRQDQQNSGAGASPAGVSSVEQGPPAMNIYAKKSSNMEPSQTQITLRTLVRRV